jgi:transcription elongation factor Elf1
MALQVPDSMEEIIYWTRRVIGKGKVMVWVKRQDCPACGKDKMGKPVGKNGKVKIRAKEYICPSCEHTVEKEEYEDTLTAEAVYTCPECGKDGDYTGPFKRKSVKGVKTFRFPCSSCDASIDVTKKMKKAKVKK